MLSCALVFGQLMRRIKQPPVLGELIGGIIIGPTVLGMLAPGFFAWMFQGSENVGIAREASIKLGMLFFLFIAGLEVNLSDLRRQGKRALLIGLVGTLLPIGFGMGLVYLLPRDFWGPAVQAHFSSFALFIGMNLANSANPVIARILMDLGLLKGDIGSLIMRATVVDDLINWTLFAIILSDIAPSSNPVVTGLPATIAMVLGFFLLVVGLGRVVGTRALLWARTQLTWPSGFIALTALVILLSASVAEGLGIHAFLGAFLAGAALGGKGREKNEAHDAIAFFVLSLFAPIYFVSMGMTTNFILNFDWLLVLIILGAAFLSKMSAVMLGAKMAGMPLSREVWAIGFGLNARGATGIILAGVGLANNLIDERIFVAVAVMAILTSLLAGPAMHRLLSHSRPVVIPGSSIPQ